MDDPAPKVNPCIFTAQCENISVVLKNKTLEAQSRIQDTYQLSGLIKGKTSWISKYQAIWYIPEIKDWIFGDLEDLGNNIPRIKSTGDQGSENFPYEIASDQFWYHDYDGWQKSVAKDISVDCIDSKGIFFN